MSTIIDSTATDGRYVEASPWPTAIRWALISSAIGIVLQLIFYLVGWMDPATMAENGLLSALVGLVAIAVSAVITYLGLKAYRDTDNRGWLTLGQAVKWALYFGLVAGVIGAIWALIYNNFIVGDALAEAQQSAINQMEEQGASEEELEMMQTVTGAVQNPFVTFFSALIGSVILSIIIGLVAGLILRTQGPRDQYA